MNNRITIRFSDDERAFLEKEAREKNITLSDVIRLKLFSYRKKELENQECEKLYQYILYNINRIGNNINQIARHVNASREIDIKVLEELSNVEDRLTEILKEILSQSRNSIS